MKIDLDMNAAPEGRPADALPQSKRLLRLRTYAGLAMLDCTAITSAFLVANVIRHGDPFASPGINALIVLLPAYIGIAADRSLYTGQFFDNWRRNAYRAVKSLATALVAVVLLSFYLHATTHLSRIVMSIGSVLSAGLLIVLRAGLHRGAMRAVAGEPITTLVIRDGVNVIAGSATVVDAAAWNIAPSVSDPEMLDRFGSLVRRAERVIVACPAERRARWAAMLKGANVQGELVATELGGLGTLRTSEFGGDPTLVVSLGPLDTRARIVKRGFDLAVALAVLVLSAPLMLLVAIVLRLDSPGPVFFRQPRMGRGNRLFSMYKFRSMHVAQADLAGSVSASRGDLRVTRVGRILRATSVDELPQLLNVLRGDMSIVGPRPHALGSLAGDRLFWDIDCRYWDRHAMKPGITGLAQIKGFRGATAEAVDLEGRLAADLDYMRGWSIWRDVRILLATTFVVLHRNAY